MLPDHVREDVKMENPIPAKKVFDTTLADCVYTYMRLADRMGIICKQKWCGVAVLGTLSIASFVFELSKIQQKNFFFAGVTASSVPLWLFFHRKIMAHSAKKFFLKARGTSAPIAGEYELSDQGLIFRQEAVEIKFLWEKIVSVDEGVAGIEIFAKPSQMAIVHRRIFDSPEEMQQWIGFISRHRQATV